MDSLLKKESDRTPRQKTSRDVLSVIFKRFPIFIGLPILIIAIIVAASMWMPKVYETSTELKIEESNFENIGIADTNYTGNRYFSRKEQLINSEINIVKGNIVLEEVVKSLKLCQAWGISAATEEESIANAVNKLGKAVNVRPKQDSWVIEIVVRDRNPELTAKIANAIATTYITKSITLNTLPQAAQFYEDKLDKEKEELASLEEQLRKIKLENRVVDLDATVEQQLQNRATFETRLTTIKTEIMTRRAKISRIREFLAKPSKDNLVPIPEIAQIRIIEDLNYRLVNLRLELDQLKQRYTEQERQVKMVADQINQVETQIKAEVRKILVQELNELTSLNQEQADLEKTIVSLDRDLLQTTEIDSDYRALQNQIKSKEQIVNDLSRKYTDSLYAGQTDERLGKVRQTSPAMVPSEPVFPNMKLNLMLGIPLAIFFSLAIVMLLEYFDRKFSSPQVVEEVLGIPVLASIQQIDMKKNPLFR